MTTRLSSLQYPMLSVFAERDGSFYMSIAEAQKFDQRPFRSMLIRRWIVFRQVRGFHITAEGRDAWQEFHHRNIQRQNPTLPLTRYFDPVAYGLKPYPKKKKALHVVGAA